MRKKPLFSFFATSTTRQTDVKPNQEQPVMWSFHCRALPALLRLVERKGKKGICNSQQSLVGRNLITQYPLNVGIGDDLNSISFHFSLFQYNKDLQMIKSVKSFKEKEDVILLGHLSHFYLMVLSFIIMNHVVLNFFVSSDIWRSSRHFFLPMPFAIIILV